jgi:hypothetical protein
MKKTILGLTIALCIFCFVAVAPQMAQAEGTYVTTIDNVDYTLVFEAGPFSPAESGTAYLYNPFGRVVGEWSYRATHYTENTIEYNVLGLGLFMSKYGLMTLYTSTEITLTQVAEE